MRAFDNMTLLSVFSHEAERITPSLAHRLNIATENIVSLDVCLEDLRQDDDVMRMIERLMDDLTAKLEQRPDLLPVKSSVRTKEHLGIRTVVFVVECRTRTKQPEAVPA